MAFTQLPTVHTGRPAAFTLTAPAYLAATAGWLAAAIAFAFAADDLAAGAIWQPSVVLTTHLVALAFLPCVVAAAVWQPLPMMLRNDAPTPAAARSCWPSCSPGLRSPSGSPAISAG